MKGLTILCLSAVLLLMVGGAACAQKTDFLRYDSPAYGIELLYPANWELLENYQGTVAAFRSPAEGPSDAFRENVNVMVGDISAQPMDLDSYVKMNIAELQKSFANFSLAGTRKDTIDGNDAVRIEFTGDAGNGTQVKWCQVYAIKGTKAYIFTYCAAPDSYVQYIPVVEQILRSIKIKGSNSKLGIR